MLFTHLRYNMKQIPILKDFNPDEVIGYLNIDETKIPDNPYWLLALGAKIERTLQPGKTGGLFRRADEEYELVCMSIQTDEQYAQYLRNHGMFV